MAELLASDRVNHQLIKTKDIIPTPSQPIKRTNSFLEATKININKINNISVFINKFFFGSDLM
jgi:hypothetical protein